MNYGNFTLLLRRHSIRFLIILSLLISATVPGYAQGEYRLSAKEKAEVFEEVWNLVNDEYYDPNLNGVDWKTLRDQYKPVIELTKTDAEFYDVIKRMVGEMKDAHTRFLTPREAREDRERKATTVGILLSKVEGKAVVEKVLPNAGGELAKVKPGMTVRTVDGVPIEKRFAEALEEVGGSSSDRALEIIAYRRILSGEPETSVKIGLRDKNGKDFEVALVRQIVEQKSEAIGKKLSSGIGYISISSFKAPISDKFKQSLLELKDTSALIIDLRYNGGGSISEVLKMAGFLINEKREFGNFIKRSGDSKQSKKSFSAGKKGGQIYSNPVVILTSKFSASGSELFSSSLQEFGRAKVLGRQTCGCLLGISEKHRLKDGSELHISDIGFLSAKGKIYEKTGVTPDKIVELKIDDLVNSYDREIDEAEKMLTEIAVQTQ